MTRRFRLILTIIFAAGFLITAPLVLLYTAGYRYDLRKNRLHMTGLIQSDSVPDGATIFLNGVATDRLTPAPLTRLLPEEYRIRYEKDGYLPWEKDVEVWSGATTFVTEAALIADAQVSEPVPIAARLATFSPDGTRIAYLSGQGKDALVSWSSLNSFSTVRPRSVPAPDISAADAELTWSPTSDRLMLIRHATGGDTILLIDADDTESTPVSPKLPSGRYAASWSSDGSTAVLVSSFGILLVESDSGQVSGPLESAAAAALVDGDLFVLRVMPEAVSLERRAPVAGAASKPLVELPLGTYRFLDVTGPALVISDLLRGRVFIIDTEDGRIIDRLDATAVRWHETGQAARLLAWNDYEMTVLMPFVPERHLITRLGARIQSCAWHPSGLSAFYLADGEPFAVDLDGREPKNVVTLAAGESYAGLAVNADEMTMYFLNDSGLSERPF